MGELGAVYYDTPRNNAWRESTFAMVCVRVCASHLPQLHRALSLETMLTRDFPWEGSLSNQGAQVDFVIERPDKIMYLCETKFTVTRLSVSSAYAQCHSGGHCCGGWFQAQCQL